MANSHCLWGTASLIVMALSAALASGQDYPYKTIRVMTSGIGGGSDFVARMVSPGLTAGLGQQVIVDNRGGLIAAEVVSRATPDGYTLLIAANAMWVGPLFRKSPYDPVNDFSAISTLTRAALILAVTPSLPVNSVKELIALAKAKPGSLNYGSTNSGGASHISMELLKYMAGVDIVRISYKTGGAAMTGVLSGEVGVIIDGGPQLMAHVKSGKLRALAVTTAQPSALAPGLPTVAATGLPGYESTQFSGLLAPAKTPKAVIARLNQEVVRVLNQPDVKAMALNSGVEAASSSPEQFAAAVRSEMSRLGKLIKEAGIKAD